MNGMRPRWWRFLGISVFLTMVNPVASTIPSDEADPAFTYPEPLAPIHFSIPSSLQHWVQPEDTALARLRIGDTGEVMDLVILDLPHWQLLHPLRRELERLRFKPATDNVEPVVVEIVARIPIGKAGAFSVVNESIMDHIEVQMRQLDPDSGRYALSPANRLDEPLELVSQGKPLIGVDAEGRVLKGRVTVEFYVDAEGVPRLVRARGEADPAVAEAAVQTVTNFRYKPPRRNGRPTVVRARVPISQGE